MSSVEDDAAAAAGDVDGDDYDDDDDDVDVTTRCFMAFFVRRTKYSSSSFLAVISVIIRRFADSCWLSQLAGILLTSFVFCAVQLPLL